MAADLQRQRTNPLGASLLGLFTELWVLGNRYEDKLWPDTNPPEPMRLANEKDIAGIEKWASRIGPGRLRAARDENVGTQRMRQVLRRCGKEVPTILHLSGHTTEIQGKKSYLPSDCGGSEVKLRGISFTDMRSWLLSGQKTAPLLVITDACDFTNFL
ncbi:hypothetical protein FRC07_003111, partial [Ceratobasidium sp. 392]